MENLLNCNGRRFRAKIEGVECDGKIRVEDGLVYLCQNEKSGISCTNKFGYKYSWVMPSISVSELELYPNTAAEIEAYKDWQVGDKVTDCDRVWEVIFRSGELVCARKIPAELLQTIPVTNYTDTVSVSSPEPEPEETLELTMDEIAEKFGIKPENLRIKKEE